jgi:hypothetical protein
MSERRQFGNDFDGDRHAQRLHSTKISALAAPSRAYLAGRPPFLDAGISPVSGKQAQRNEFRSTIFFRRPSRFVPLISSQSELDLRALAPKLQNFGVGVDDKPFGLERADDRDIARFALAQCHRRSEKVSGPFIGIPGPDHVV